MFFIFFSKQNQNKSTHFLTSGSRLYAKLLALGQDSQPVLEEEKSAAEESPGGRAGGGRRGTGRTRRRGGRATADPAATAEEPAASAVAEGDDRACGSRGRAGQAHRRGGQRSCWRLPRKSWPSSPPRRSWLSSSHRRDVEPTARPRKKMMLVLSLVGWGAARGHVL